ncbi:MAG: adenylyltransferase/cytidyltransferase family protein [Thermoplasmata archaeon]
MVRVMATGVFDILHLGHVYFLKEARKYGDELVVVVARDNTAKKLKHLPIINEQNRMILVSNLKPVDRAILGHEDDMYKTVAEVKPDVIVLGYDQAFDEKEIERKCKEMGLMVKVVRLDKFSESDLNGTRKIVAKIVEAYNFQKYMENVEHSEVNKK